MFRQEKDFLPFNEISHLTGESLRFSTNLRKKENDRKPTKQKQVAPVLVVAKLAAPVFDTKRNNDTFAVKETNCVNSQCLLTNQTYLLEFQERMDLLSSIEACEAALEQQEALMEEATSQYQASLKLHHDASESFNELGLREVDMKSKRGEVFKEQIAIDNEIRRTEKVKAQLEGIQQHPNESIVSDLNFTSHKKLGTANAKHDGVFRLNSEGVHAWTCCNSLERDHHGCMDDQSVGVRSSLPLVKNFFSNHLRVKHPLQHGSGLFMENNIKFNLQLGSAAHRQSDSVLFDDNTSHNHTSSLFLGKGSAIDYFSVNKPATRVAAMEPYANKSIRSTSRLVFGVSIPPENAHPEAFLTRSRDLADASRSQTSRARPATASAQLQRSSIVEVFPHLDTKIRQHQVEQRYIGVDHLKPPPADDPGSPTANHNATKHYALYSRPYAHANTNTVGHGFGHGHGLLTQSVHGHGVQTAARPFSAHARSSVPNFNSSTMSNVSWGCSLAEQNPATTTTTTTFTSTTTLGAHSPSHDCGGDHEDQLDTCDGRSEAGVHSAHSQQSVHSLRTPPEANITSSPLPAHKPKLTETNRLTSSPIPRYAQSKSLPVGHKALIGKQRAVPERVKLIGNRPLTSGGANNLYAL